MNNKFYFIYIFLIGLVMTLSHSCKKDDVAVTKKDPVITWANPADITVGTLLSATQLNATADVPGTFVYTPAAGTSLVAGANQELKVVFTPTDAAAFNTASKTVKINVTAKKIPVITWINPADITVGTALGATQLNATADVPGTFVYTPPAGTSLAAGSNQDIKVDFTPANAVTHSSASKTVKINVIAKIDPDITWANPADITVGTALSATQLNATANVPGTFIYTPAAGTKLAVGASQDLKVDFTPNDAATYNTTSKTVKINVKQLAGDGGVTTVKFNSGKTYGTMTDQEGNTYKTITIGTQTWMAENLRVTKYRNGDPIPNVKDNAAWIALTTGAYSNYDNTTDKNKIATYGRLYNWFAVDDSRNLAPEGWHVATDEEWITLATFLGGINTAGSKMKETGNTHWNSPNTDATNESGFSAVPLGLRRNTDGVFNDQGVNGYWWSSTAYSTFYARSRNLVNNLPNFYRGSYYREGGFAVRLIKD
jgi:uncharacterized protein (TIGR02145 family)